MRHIWNRLEHHRNDTASTAYVECYAAQIVRHNIGSILLNIHEVWPRPFWGGSSHQNKTPEEHFIGYFPFASLEGDKRPDKINQNQEFEHFMP